jgi:cytoskeletal protein CcmA (bactofilin family)
MKKILFITLGFLTLLTVIFTPAALAQQKQKTESILPKNAVINQDYLTAKDNVRISGTVNGDVYAAGGNIDVDGTINGDLLVAGGNITITGVVKNDIRVAGGDITITNAKVGGSVTAVGGQIEIDKSTTIAGSLVGTGGRYKLLGPIGKGVTLAGGQAIFGNSVGGNVMAGIGQLSFLPNTNVNGNVYYWSDNKAQFSGTASVSGAVKQYPPSNNNRDNSKAITAGILGTLFLIKLTDIIALLIVGLLLIALLPVYSQNAAAFISSHFVLSLLVGFLGIIITPVIIMLLVFTVIGIPLGILLLILFLATLWFARIFALLALGKFVMGKINSRTGNGWALVAGVIIYCILQIIPIVSFFTDILVALSGFGTFLTLKRNYYTNLRKKKLI